MKNLFRSAVVAALIFVVPMTIIAAPLNGCGAQMAVVRAAQGAVRAAANQYGNDAASGASMGTLAGDIAAIAAALGVLSAAQDSLNICERIPR